MTYSNGVGETVPELKLRVENGDYVKLRGSDEEEGSSSECSIGSVTSVWFWVKLIFLLSCLGILAFVIIKWIGPFLIEKELIPFINWVRSTFSIPILGLLLFASVALFPSILLPSSPSMWMAGLTFGYGNGILLILSAASIGVTLPYLIGHLFLHKMQEWLKQYPKKAAILRAAGEGTWFHQFQAVTLIRVSPFPYMIYNYCALATGVHYGPYILGSLVGMVPEIFVSIYTGIMLRTLAVASDERHTFGCGDSSECSWLLCNCKRDNSLHNLCEEEAKCDAIRGSIDIINSITFFSPLKRLKNHPYHNISSNTNLKLIIYKFCFVLFFLFI